MENSGFQKKKGITDYKHLLDRCRRHLQNDNYNANDNNIKYDKKYVLLQSSIARAESGHAFFAHVYHKIP